jgi:hypothetical protein
MDRAEATRELATVRSQLEGVRKQRDWIARLLEEERGALTLAKAYIQGLQKMLEEERNRAQEALRELERVRAAAAAVNQELYDRGDGRVARQLQDELRAALSTSTENVEGEG